MTMDSQWGQHIELDRGDQADGDVVKVAEMGDTVIFHGADGVDYPSIVTEIRNASGEYARECLLTVFLKRAIEWIWAIEGTFHGQFSQRETR